MEEESRVDTNPPQRNKGGRPKGTTKAKAHADSVNIEYAKNLIAQRYAKLQERCKEEGITAPAKSLDGMIVEAKEELGIPPDVEIIKRTILSRIARKRTVNVVPHAGTATPMLKIEPLLVQLCIRIGRIGQPVQPPNFLALANSLIKGKGIEKEVIKFKAKHCGYDINSENADLGIAYFRGFMNRNKHLIDLKRAKKYPKDRSQWTTYTNFKHMLDHTYEELHLAKLVIKHSEQKLFNAEGVEVFTPEEAHGLPTVYEFVKDGNKNAFSGDESGGNTDQSSDKHNGGAKSICAKGAVPRIICSTSNHRWTMIPVNAFDGTAVLIVLIHQGEFLPEGFILGVDHFVETIEDNDNDEFFRLNSGGVGKRYPGGPVCQFKGKTIPCMYACSSSGGVTGEILLSLLKRLDEVGVTDRTDGKSPHFQLDAHDTRFDLPFLEYINAEDTKWSVCIGVPNGTTKWQTGDDSRLNGRLKNGITEHKEKIIEFKMKNNLPLTLSPTDIVPIVNAAWGPSFGNPENGRKALAQRGWFPLTYNILLDPEIAATKPKEAVQVDDATQAAIVTPPVEAMKMKPTWALTPESFNTTTGFGAEILDSIMCSEAREKSKEKRKRDFDEKEAGLKELFARDTKLTAGKFFLNSCQLSTPLLVEYKTKKRKIEAAAAQQKDYNAAKRRAALHKRVHAVENCTKNSDEWTAAEFGTMLVYHKSKKDPKVASTLEGMRTQWLERKNRIVERLLTMDQIDAILGAQLENNDEKKDLGIIVTSGFI